MEFLFILLMILSGIGTVFGFFISVKEVCKTTCETILFKLWDIGQTIPVDSYLYIIYKNIYYYYVTSSFFLAIGDFFNGLFNELTEHTIEKQVSKELAKNAIAWFNEVWGFFF